MRAALVMPATAALLVRECTFRYSVNKRGSRALSPSLLMNVCRSERSCEMLSDAPVKNVWRNSVWKAVSSSVVTVRGGWAAAAVDSWDGCARRAGVVSAGAGEASAGFDDSVLLTTSTSCLGVQLALIMQWL